MQIANTNKGLWIELLKKICSQKGHFKASAMCKAQKSNTITTPDKSHFGTRDELLGHQGAQRAFDVCKPDQMGYTSPLQKGPANFKPNVVKLSNQSINVREYRM